MERIRKRLQSDMGWSNEASITVQGLDLPGDVLGKLNLGDFAFLEIKGHKPTLGESIVFNAMLATLVEHGMTPMVIAARLTYLGAPESLQGAVAAGILGMGTTFAGTVEGSARILQETITKDTTQADLPGLAEQIVAKHVASKTSIPGIGHPLHKPIDPRTPRLFQLAEESGQSGRYVELMKLVASAAERALNKPGQLPVNATGALGALSSEMDNALWDLQAASAGQALWRTWNGRGMVPLTWVLTRQSPALMAAEAVAVKAKYGFDSIKVKGGQGLETDVRAMHELRAALGDRVRLYVDANGAYPFDQALDYVAAMAEAGAEVVEDPCGLYPDAGFTQLQAATPVPVLVDFGCESLRDAELFLERGAKAFSLKPGRFGLTDTREMARLSAQAGCKVMVGMFGESALGTLPALSLASTLAEDALPAEVTWFLAMTQQCITHAIDVSNGVATLPDTAGCASLVDWSRLTPLPL